jgi:hypothetical protein
MANDEGRVRAAIAAERRRTIDQIAALERSVAGIIEASELTSTDDEHDPEGATIAYERAQVLALLRQARDDLVALDHAIERVDDGGMTTGRFGHRQPQMPQISMTKARKGPSPSRRRWEPSLRV